MVTPRSPNGLPLNSPAPGPSNPSPKRKEDAVEDQRLVARAQNGEMEAFRQLVTRHERRAFLVALSVVRDEHDAKELVQEAFLRVHKNIGNFQGGSSFFTWLYRIVMNLGIDFMRRPGRKNAVGLAPNTTESDSVDFDHSLLAKIHGSDPSERMRRSELASELEKALNALPEIHRTVILLREVEGLSYEEMAQAVGVSKGTIMSRLFHARQKLQKALVDCYREQIGEPPNEGSFSEPEEKRP